MKFGTGFENEALSPTDLEAIREKARRARGDILTMTTLAASGHPGGSMSSLDLYMVIYHCANIHPDNRLASNRDRVVVSHGHTSPGVYSTLFSHGFIDREEAICGFRQAWSPFEGHIEREVPGVEWSTGNLGQGLSAAVGMAFAGHLTGEAFHVFCLMGDGEQQKGQIAEARRVAAKFGFKNITAIVDYNQLQISGSIHDVMPQHLRAGWEADGWEVVEIDGHDLQQIYGALRKGHHSEKPLCIIAHTVMGKGVPAIEHKHKYHGSPLSVEQLADALTVLGLPNELEHFKARRPEIRARHLHVPVHQPTLSVYTGTPRTYAPDVKTDNRSAWGAALADIGAEHLKYADASKVAVFDCDLAESVKTGAFHQVNPAGFLQVGIQEHNAAVMAGALSTQGVLTFWSDFGVFGVDEAFNQQRLNDINHTQVKLVCTHIGLDVGEDGKTHQAIDYIGLLRNLFGFKVILPADPNETDRAIRYAAATPGNFFVGMGRSKLPVLTLENGSPAFAGDFRFEYGQAVTLREGHEAVIFATGTLTHRALQAWQLLKADGIHARLVHIACPLALDPEVIAAAAEVGLIVTCEDHHAGSGLGSLVAEALVDGGHRARLIRLGVTAYQPSGTADDVFAHAGLDGKGIARRVREALGRTAV